MPVGLALALCALLLLLQLGWLPGFSRAWGLNLWQYQHPVFGAVSMALFAPLAFHRVRGRVLGALAQAGRRFGSDRRALWLGLAAIAIGLWLLRERRFQGDSTILLYQAMSGSMFAFPEIGASWLLSVSMRLGAMFGAPGEGLYQLWVCLSGAIAVACFLAAGRALLTGPGAALFAVCVLGGGIARVFAGHLEVYAFTVACAGAYLWSGAAFLRRRCGFGWVSLAFGFGLWMHLSFAFFAPSLALLPILAQPGRPVSHYARRWFVALCVGIAPIAVFLAVSLAISDGAEFAALRSSLRAAVGSGANEARELWLRGWGRPAGAGTRYVILSAPHLNYLGNALFLLAPAVLPLLVWLLRNPRRFVATPQAVFLVSAALSMLIYSLVLRPVWGPYDWDLFSLTAVCLACLAGYLLAEENEPVRSHLALISIAATLAFVTIPLFAAGIATPRDAGPFSDDGLAAVGDETTEQTFDRQIGPWL